MSFRPTQKLLIAVPYYHNPELLYRTVERLAALARPGRYDLTVSVMDDASPHAPDVSRIQIDPNIRYIRQPRNLGIVGNYNSCVEMFCREGPAWTLILDSDDAPMAEAFDAVLSLSQKEMIGMIVGGYRIVESDKPEFALKERRLVDHPSELDSKAAFQWLYSRNRTASSGVWIHSEAYGDARYDPECLSCLDWDLYIRLASRCSVSLSDKIFCTVLHHEQNLTWGLMKSGEARRNERKTLQKNWPLAHDLNLPGYLRAALRTKAETHCLYRSLQMRFLPR